MDILGFLLDNVIIPNLRYIKLYEMFCSLLQDFGDPLTDCYTFVVSVAIDTVGDHRKYVVNVYREYSLHKN